MNLESNPKVRMRLIPVVLVGAVAVMLAAAQEIRKETLTIDGPRPLAKAAQVLEQRYGWAINYEDPPWDYAGDVEDRTDPKWRAQHPDVQHRMLIPKPGQITLEYEVDAVTGQPKSTMAVLQALVDAHAAQGNPGIFRIVSEAGYFSIVPSKVRDAQGRWTEVAPILDTLVSFPSQLRSIGEALQVLEQQMQQRAGRKLWPAGVGANFMALGRTLAGANEEQARVALRRIVDEPAYGPSGSTVARRTVWHLYYQPGWDWALNLHAAPGGRQTAPPASVPPATNAYRLQETPARWFERKGLLAQPAAPQPTPHFTREGTVPFQADRPRLLAPGMIVTIYGEHLGPEPWCSAPIPQNGPYPIEACGVRVMVGSSPAGLMFVGARQINLKIPADAPAEGSARLQICVRDVCSDPVVFGFSTRKAYIRVQGTAYVHMPVWIEADQPMPHDIWYPCMVWPWDFGGYAFEVRRNGQPLAPVRPQPPNGGLIGGGSVAPPGAPRSRLPLHLFYRLDQPGTYSVRFTSWKYGRDLRTPEIATQSDWSDIAVLPFSEAQRDVWLRAEAAKMQSATPGQLVGDIIPSLLARPDEKALAVLLQIMDHPNDLVRQFGRQSLAAFDTDVLRRVIPPDRRSGLPPSRVRVH